MAESKLKPGTYTALVTPFHPEKSKSIDWKAFKNLIDYALGRLSERVTGFVPCGTTGESPTLTHDEHAAVIKATVDFSGGRVPVIAGTGSNSTRETIELTNRAHEAGADAALIVTPYYNKPGQQDMVEHYAEIARSTDLPIILYNIEGRTGVNVETSTLLRIIGECGGKVVGVKEASGNEDQIKDVIVRTKEYNPEFLVLSGNDGDTEYVIRNGGDGVISVVGNILPMEMSKFVKTALDGNWEEAERINGFLKSLYDVTFIETNPKPIKHILGLQELCSPACRPPLYGLAPKSKQVLTREWARTKKSLSDFYHNQQSL